MNSEARKVTITVFSFWFIVLNIYSIFYLKLNFIDSLISFKYILVGTIIGVLSSFFAVFLIIKTRKEGTLATNSLGITCTIGKVPAWNKAPKKAKLADIPKIPKEISLAIKNIGESADYKNLAISLIRVLANDLTIPATHHEGHGGQTLFQHTINVVKNTLKRAQDYSYTGLYGKTGKLSVGLRNSKYIFDKNDPAILIIALAHDIGKIIGYVYDGGKIVGMKKNHDTLSSLMINCMAEFVALPLSERQCITGVLSFYHHPQGLPMDANNRAVDDRTIALLELIRECDIESSSLEDETNVEKIVVKKLRTAEHKEVTEEDIWTAFNEIIEEPGRTNGSGRNGQIVLGQKCGDLCYFIEPFVRNELLKKLNIPDPGVMGDGTHPITRKLNSILIDKGFSYHKHNGLEYGYSRAFFTVDFIDPENGEKLTTWKATIIIKPNEQIPFLNQMKSHKAIAEIVKPIFGESSAKNKKGAKREIEVEEDTTIEPPKKDEPSIDTSDDIFGSFMPEETTFTIPNIPVIEEVSEVQIETPVIETVEVIDENEVVKPIDFPVEPKVEPNVIEVEQLVIPNAEELNVKNNIDPFAQDLDAESNMKMFGLFDMDAENKALEERSRQINEEKKNDIQKEREKGIKPALRRGLEKFDKQQNDLMNGNTILSRKLIGSSAESVVRMDFQLTPNLFPSAQVGSHPIKRFVYIALDNLEKIYLKTTWEDFITKGLFKEKIISDGTRLVRINAEKNKDIYGADAPE